MRHFALVLTAGVLVRDSVTFGGLIATDPRDNAPIGVEVDRQVVNRAYTAPDASGNICCCKKGPCDPEKLADSSSTEMLYQWPMPKPASCVGCKDKDSQVYCCKERNYDGEGRCDHGLATLGFTPYNIRAEDVPGLLFENAPTTADMMCVRPACPDEMLFDPSTNIKDKCLCEGGVSTAAFDHATATWSGNCHRCPADSELADPPTSPPSCVCEGKASSIEWNPNEAKWTGQCHNCPKPGSTWDESSRECKCLKGYEGKPTINDGGITSCTHIRCPEGSSGHPDCTCDQYHKGRVVWKAEGYYEGQCEAATCPDGFDVVKEKMPCRCPAGTKGHAKYDAAKNAFTGTCKKVECPQPDGLLTAATSTSVDGRCECKDFAAVPEKKARLQAWDMETQTYPDLCVLVACPSNAQRGLGERCECKYGYMGALTFGYSKTTSSWGWEGQCDKDPEQSFNLFDWLSQTFSCSRAAAATGTSRSSACIDNPEAEAVNTAGPWNQARRNNEKTCQQCREAVSAARTRFGATLPSAKSVEFSTTAAANNPSDIKKSYFAAARALHPDKTGADEAAAALFTAVSSCYGGLVMKAGSGQANAGYVDCCKPAATGECAPPG